MGKDLYEPQHQFPGFQDMTSFLNGNPMENSILQRISQAQQISGSSSSFFKNRPLKEDLHVPNIRLGQENEGIRNGKEGKSKYLSYSNKNTKSFLPNVSKKSSETGNIQCLPPLKRSGLEKQVKCYDDGFLGLQELKPFELPEKKKKVRRKKRKPKFKPCLLPENLLIYIVSFLNVEDIISKIRFLDRYWARRVRKARNLWQKEWEWFIKCARFEELPFNRTEWNILVSMNSIDFSEWNGAKISSLECLKTKFNENSALVRCFQQNASWKYLVHWIYFLSEATNEIQTQSTKVLLGGSYNETPFYDRESILVFRLRQWCAVIKTSNRFTSSTVDKKLK